MKHFLKNLLFSNTFVIITFFLAASLSIAFGIHAYENNTLRVMMFSAYIAGIMMPMLGSIERMCEEIRIGGENCKPYVSLLVVIAYSFSNHNLVYDFILHLLSFAVTMYYIMRLYSIVATKHKILESDVLRGILGSNFKFWNIEAIDNDAVFFNYKIPLMKYSRLSGGKLILSCNDTVYSEEMMEKVAHFMNKEIFDLIPDDYITYEMYHI